MHRKRIRQRLARTAGALCIAAALVFVSAMPARAVPPVKGSIATVLEARLRRPVALALTRDGRWLFVANRRSGTISAVDTESQAVVGEASVGGTLADLARLPDGRLLAVDESGAQLVLLAGKAPELHVVNRLPLTAMPVSVDVSPDGGRAAVALLWLRQVILIELPGPAGAIGGVENDGATWRTTHTISVPFAPRKLLFVADGVRLVVADAFGGNLAIVDVPNGKLLSTRRLPAHNIRGLAVRQCAPTGIFAVFCQLNSGVMILLRTRNRPC